MIFTKVATAVAWIVFVPAITIIGSAFYIGFTSDIATADILARRYLAAPSVDVAATRAYPFLAFALILGVLAEISQSLGRVRSLSHTGMPSTDPAGDRSAR